MTEQGMQEARQRYERLFWDELVAQVGWEAFKPVVEALFAKLPDMDRELGQCESMPDPAELTFETINVLDLGVKLGCFPGPDNAKQWVANQDRIQAKLAARRAERSQREADNQRYQEKLKKLLAEQKEQEGDENKG